MQASLDRILSGRSASCSCPSLPHAATYVRAQRRVWTVAPAGVPGQRAAAMVAAAGRPQRPAPKASGLPTKKAAAGAKAKGGKGPKPAPPPKTQRVKPPTSPQPSRAGTGGTGKSAAATQPAPPPAAPPCKLPRPAIGTIVIATAAVGSTAAVQPGSVRAAAAAIGVVSGPAGGGAASALPESGLQDAPEDWRHAPVDFAASDDDVNDAGVDGDDEAEGEAEEAESDTGSDGFLFLDDSLDDPAAASGAAGAEGMEGADEGGADENDEGEGEGEMFPEIHLNLPNPTNVRVKIAKFLQSCDSVSGCPPPRFPEFAVIGRSNVGKSSLINMMTGRKDLAMVSKQPGKTKCINHFLINESWYLVDLPGYGYAKVGLQGRRHFDAFTREYFKARPNLAMVLLLVDASIPPQRIDLEYANWLTDNEVPFALVFTKADKRRKGLNARVRDSHVVAFKRALLRDLAFLPPSLLTSSAKGVGRGELMSFIAGLRIAYERSGRLEAIKHGMV